MSETERAAEPSLVGRASIHWPRRIFHCLSGTLLGLAGILFPERKDFLFLLGVLLAIDVIVELLRLFFPRWNHFLNRSFRILMREGEQTGISGILYYLVGCLISAIVFPREIAVIAIFFLAWGDPVAAIMGLRLRKLYQRRHPKSWQGSLACFLVCTLITWIVSYCFSKTSHLSLDYRFGFAVIGGISATLGEALPLRTDDNLSLPLVSGALLWLTAAILNLIPGLYF